MAWASSARRARLPSNWTTLRATVLARDNHLCQLRYPHRCAITATEVDHAGTTDDHRPEVLRAVCTPCHKHRTQQQSTAARPPRARPAERHPGLL
jgi:5-methylcytosine-specific restriction protein A